MEPYDAVIIGAGPSGLAAAARLAHFGVSVCVLEAHGRLGGLNSWHHVNGREISSGLHAFTNYNPTGRGGPLGKLLRQLRLKYSDIRLQPQGQSSIRFPGATLRFSNDVEHIRQQVAENFPGQIGGFDRLRARIRETDEGELTDIRASARERLECFLSESLLIDMLLCPVMFYGNPGGVGDGRDAERTRPDMDWLLFCVVWKCIFESGLAYPAGGMRPLWELLAARIREDGGEVRLSSRVVELRRRGESVAAAILESGEEVAGKRFFSSAGAVETDTLLRSTAGQKPPGSISVAEGICLLDRPPAEAGMDDTILFYSLDDTLRFGRPYGLVEHSCGLVCAPGNYLHRNGGDENIIKISLLANYPVWRELNPGDYISAKQETAAAMSAALRRLEVVPAKARNNPGKFADFDDLFTPMTLQRFTLHAEGALYGSTIKSRTGATSCRNLFLIGTDQGFHGIVGAMLSGVAMANLHLLGKQ